MQASARRPLNGAATTLRADTDNLKRWTDLEPGLAWGEFPTQAGSVLAVRVDPEVLDFVLCSSGSDGSEPRTLAQWGRDENLLVAINASMYLPDGSTSTGYMRDGAYVNNGRIVGRFGVFFVAGPDDPDLPRATLLEKSGDIWEELLSHYRLVVQNYRMTSSDRQILWSPGGPLYSISAVAQDGEGHILFLHSKEPVEAYTFAQQLLHLPIDVRTVMYVEGGGQAGLYIHSSGLHRVEQGVNLADFFVSGNRTVRLPNVIGVRRRADTPAGAAQTAQSAPAAEKTAPGGAKAAPADASAASRVTGAASGSAPRAASDAAPGPGTGAPKAKDGSPMPAAAP